MNPSIDYKSEPQEDTIAVSSTQQQYGRSGNLASVEVQDLDSALAVFLHFVDNPWCLDFDGSTEVVDLDAAVGDLNTHETGSIHFGFFAAAAGSGQRVIFAIGDTNAETALWIAVKTDNTLEAHFVVAGTTQWTVVTAEAIEEDKWIQAKLIHDGTTPKIYFGRNTPKQTLSGGTQTAWLSTAGAALDNVNIGALDYNSAGNANFFQGKVDYLKVIEGVQQNGVGTTTKQLELLLETGSGTTATDGSTNGNNGTITNATQWETRTRGRKHSADYARVYTPDEAPIHRGLWITNEDGASTVDVIVARTFNNQ